MNFSKLILIVSNVPILIAFILVLVWFRNFGRELRVFSVFLIFSCLLQLTSLTLWYFSINNLPLLHIYVGLGFLFLAWFYSVLMQGFINKWVFWIVTALFLVFVTVNLLVFQDAFTFSSNALTVESVLVVVFSLSTFNLFLNDSVKAEKRLLLKSLNWINAGLFLYFASCIVLFYFGEFITRTTSVREFRSTWILHSFFSTIMYVCFIIGLWKHPRT